VVGFERLDRFAKTVADRRYALQLFRRQVVEVLVHRIAGMDFVLNPVDAGHQHGGKCEVRVRRRIGEPDLDALAIRRRRIRDTAGRRPVACRVGEQNRCFETGDQAFVAIGRGVGERVERLGVLDDAADIVQRRFRQVCVT